MRGKEIDPFEIRRTVWENRFYKPNGITERFYQLPISQGHFSFGFIHEEQVPVFWMMQVRETTFTQSPNKIKG